MLCRVEMPANSQIYGRFYRYRLLNRSGQGVKAILGLLCVLYVVFLAAAIWAGLPWPLVAVLTALLAAYFIFNVYARPISEFGKTEGAALRTETTIFTAGGLQRSVRGEEEGMVDSASLPYTSLSSAVETKRDFYLFTTQAQAYMIDKAYFTNGSPEQLRELLRAALGTKFTSKF
ncbi:YcxB family protein [Ruminococcaceae bacterium OttesenSCG-928-O06]|nr:YcxB family protein [Ruminococcaceae bacterium OttesenSCG-928-O06]